MDLSAIKRLLQSRRPSDDYIAGVQGFLKFAYSGKRSDAKIRCPCVKCVNRKLQMQETVNGHLVCNGMLRGYTIWGCHGETASYISANKDSEPPRPSLNTNMRQVVQEAFGYIDNEHHTNGPHAPGLSEHGPDAETQDFFDLLRAVDEPLWEGCELSKLSASYSSASDGRPVLGDVTYYGRIIDIIELNYSGNFSVVLFKCEWVDVISKRGVKKDKYGYTLVNFSHLIHTGEKIIHEPYIFPNQADQVFYAEDKENPGWSVVMKMKPRDIYDTGCDEWEDDVENEPFHVTHLRDMFNNANVRHQWARRDIEGTTVDASGNGSNDQS